jgi:hypothetical protein
VNLGTGIAQSVYRLAKGWTVRGSNPGGGRDFTHASRPALRPTHLPIQWVPGLSRGVKQPGRDVDHPPFCAVVKKIVELYLPSPSGRSWPVKGEPYLCQFAGKPRSPDYLFTDKRVFTVHILLKSVNCKSHHISCLLSVAMTKLCTVRQQ